MKRKILTLIMLFVATVALAQVPKHQRVLNYVPDSCYSLTLLNLDTLARVVELESLHRENVLKPLYDSVKFSKKLIQSWIKRDNKVGIDFTATAAMADSRYYLLPLNNERNFEKMVRSIDKSLPPFETMTDPEGRTFRCMFIEGEYGMNSALICTEDVACFVMLTNLSAIYNAQPPVVEGTDSLDMEAWINSILTQETPMQVWTRLSHSKFASSEAATTMLANGWDSYTGYKQGSSILRAFSTAIADLVSESAEMQKTVNQLGIEIYSKGEVQRDRLTSYSEFHIDGQQPGMQDLKSSPNELKKILPYISGDYTVMATCTMEGFGELMKPYAALKRWGELSQLLNKPFVFTMSALGENNIMFSTTVEHPEEVRGMLERYVETSNHITDSVRKNKPIVEVVEEPLEEPVIRAEEVSEESETQTEKSGEPVDNEFDTIEMFGQSFAFAVDSEDSTIDMKTLVYKKIDGWDAYIILTNKKEMDYETYTEIVKEDTSCVLVKDDFLFFTKSLDAIHALSQPLEREWPKEYFEHNFYVRADFSTLEHLIGMDFTLPVHDMVGYIDNNSFTMSINAEPGLRHGVLYEMVKFAVELFQQLDF